MLFDNSQLATVKNAKNSAEVITKAEFARRVNEIKRCKDDLLYFARNYFRIISLKDGLTLIDPYPKQAELLTFIRDTKRVICLASRQSGKTTSYCVYCLWLMCFYPNKSIMLAANKATTAIEILSRIRLAYEYLPSWLKPAIVTYNKSEVVVSNGSKAHAFATASDACRGFSANCVTGNTMVTVLDELTNTEFDISMENLEMLMKASETLDVELLKVDMFNQTVYKNTRFKIKTPEGFKAFKGLMVGENKFKLRLTFSDGEILSCTYKHKLIDINDNEIYAENVVLHETVLWGNHTVTHIEEVENDEKVYDFLEIEDTHTYLTQGDHLNHQCVILDEFSYVPGNVANAFFSSVYPVVSTDPNSKVIIVSTAHDTINNLYYDLWTQALAADTKDPDQWQAFRMDWWDVPWRDEAWKKDQIASIGIERFRVEFGNEFIASNQARLIPDDIIAEQRKRSKQTDKLYVKSSTGQHSWTIAIYERFEIGQVYVAAADVGEGVGADSSTLIILNITDMAHIKLAAIFKSSAISINEFAALSARILHVYGVPLLLAESNGVGAGYLSILDTTYQYPRLLSYNDKSIGIHANANNKLSACMWLRELLMSDELEFSLYDANLIEQLSYFSKTPNKSVTSYAAPKKMHDDLVMALIWAVFLLQPDLLKFGANIVKTGKTKLGVEIPIVLAYDASDDVQTLPAFLDDGLSMAIMNMTGDIEAEWFSPDTANEITTSLDIIEPYFIVHGSDTSMYEDDEDFDLQNPNLIWRS